MYETMIDTRDIANLVERKLEKEIGKDINISLKPLNTGFNIEIYSEGEKIGEIWIDKKGESFGFILDSEGEKEINLELKELSYLMEKF